MDDKPDWAIILRYMYDNQESELDASLKGHRRVSVPRTSEIIRELEINQPEARDALVYMLTSDLVTAEAVGNSLKLTPKGFQVAHERRMQEREKKQEDRRIERQQILEDERVERQEEREDQRAKRQHEINRAVAFLSLGLMVVTTIDSAVRVFVGERSFTVAYAVVLAGLGFVFLFTMVLNHFGLLSSASIE